jgi:uncharacterized protein with NRDE domain
MCLILFAWQTHPDHPLIVAANRDEFFARPAAPLAAWLDHPQVIAGRDLSAGGTWLGLSRANNTFRFAGLTNYRDPAQNPKGQPSRGALVADFLTGSESPQTYLDRIEKTAEQCLGFNLLTGHINASNPQASELWWSSNISLERRPLAPGIYGLSNHLLDSPWPKVSAGKTALRQAIQALPDERALHALLRAETIYPDADLPATGIPLDWERALSAAFIRTPTYGTRASTLIQVSAGNTAIIDEQTWLAGTQSGAAAGVRRRYRVVGGLSARSVVLEHI